MYTFLCKKLKYNIIFNRLSKCKILLTTIILIRTVYTINYIVTPFIRWYALLADHTSLPIFIGTRYVCCNNSKNIYILKIIQFKVIKYMKRLKELNQWTFSNKRVKYNQIRVDELICLNIKFCWKSISVKKISTYNQIKQI